MTVKNSKGIELYRGDNAGVFAGPDGYYAAYMAPDGVSHGQGRGHGWSTAALREQNAIARAMDTDDDNYLADCPIHAL